MRSKLFCGSAPVIWLSWMAGPAKATIEKIVIARNSGTAANSPFFMCMTSCEVWREPVKFFALLRRWEEQISCFFLSGAKGIGRRAWFAGMVRQRTERRRPTPANLVRTIPDKTLMHEIRREPAHNLRWNIFFLYFVKAKIDSVIRTYARE